MATILEPTSRMREMLVATSAFQTWVGCDMNDDLETRKTAAREHVYLTEIHKSLFAPKIMPCALVFLEPYEGTRRSAGGNAYRFTFGLEVILFASLTADQQRHFDQRTEAALSFGETAFGIAAAVSAIGGTADHLILEGACTQLFPPVLNGFDVEEEGGVDWPYVCTAYRWQSMRCGASVA